MIEQLLNILVECEDAKTRAALRQLISDLLQEAPPSQTQKISKLTYQELKESAQQINMTANTLTAQDRIEKGRGLGLTLELQVVQWFKNWHPKYGIRLIERIEHLDSNSGSLLYTFADIAIHSHSGHLAFVEIKSRRRTAQYISTPSDEDDQTRRLQRQYQKKMESHPNALYFILYADYREPVDEMVLYEAEELLEHYSYRLYQVPAHHEHIKHAEQIISASHLGKLYYEIGDRLDKRGGLSKEKR